MDSTRCPKCASLNAEGAWICQRCEWILDPSVLMPAGAAAGAVEVVGGRDGIGIDEDDEHALRTSPVIDAPDMVALLAGSELAQGDPGGFEVDIADMMGGDAIILGKLDDGDTESLHSDRTGSFPIAAGPAAPVPPAQVYLSSDLARLLHVAAVPRRTHDAVARRGFLRPIEGLAFDLVDGHRSLLDLRAETGLSENDLRVVLAILIEKAMIEVPPAPVDAAQLDAAQLAAAQEDLEDATRALPDVHGFDERTSEIEDLPPLIDERAALRVASSVRVDLPRFSTPPPTQEVFDELLMVPLPAAQAPEPAPRAAREPAAPLAGDVDTFQVPRSSEMESARPAMRVEPLRSRSRPTPMPPSSASRSLTGRAVEEPESGLAYKPKAGLTLSRAASAAPAGAPPPQASPKSAPPSSDAQARALQFYEMAIKDLREGRAGRAWGYAKMAADADPTDEKYRLLLADWGKMVGGASSTPKGSGGAAPSAQDLFEASQSAEQAGDYEGAVAHARKLCEVAPTSAAAFNRLSVLLATRVKDFKAAYNAATTAVELDGSNMTYQSNMMKILAKLESGDDKASGASAKGGLVGKLFGK